MKKPFRLPPEVIFLALCAAAIYLASRVELHETPPYSGIVTGKEWSPESNNLMPVVVGKSVMLLPHRQEERFYVVVSGRRFEVSREEFDRIQIKDEWTEHR